MAVLGLLGCTERAVPSSVADDGSTGGDAGGGEESRTCWYQEPDEWHGSKDSPVGVCPATPPSGVCAEEGLICWYGDDPRYRCRTQLVCQQGRWTEVDFFPSGRDCEDAARCPADPKQPPANLCPMEGRCYYPSTLEECYCASPVAMANPPPELSVYRWGCFKVTAAGCSAPRENVPDRCPAIAPNVGQPCSLEADVECAYPFGFGDDGWCSCTIRCVSGRWLLQKYGLCVA